MLYVKTLLKLFVSIGFFVSPFIHAGSYEDFFRAIKRDDSSVIQQLLQRGFDPNTLDPEGQPGLMIALREPSQKVAKTLIDWPKTDINLLTSGGESPLMLAAIKGEFELAQRLIAKDAAVNKTGWTPLHYAATAGDVKMISLLLENHAFIDAGSPNGSTPLMMACKYGTEDAVRILLAEGADPGLKNQQGLSAANFAEQADRADLAAIVNQALRAKQPARPAGTW